MFTGIIEELGTLLRVEGSAPWARLVIGAGKVLEGTCTGDSIAVNGVCLTVVAVGRDSFTAEVMHQTLTHTNLGDLRPGSRVNLERALCLGGRLGGHLVSGHVDGVGVIARSQRVGIATVLDIRAPEEIRKYLVPRGSVAVDGISLTVAEKTGDGFSLSLIPHTLAHTTLGIKGVGDRVNLEADMVAKYLEGLLSQAASPTGAGITEELLARNGFI
ncbi:MAG: riboflavin synthase [Clostridia bacterium]|nr:MAG: riboflavin synthase [Clostridia bacterium]